MAVRRRGAAGRVDDLHGEERFPRNIRELALEDGRGRRRWFRRRPRRRGFRSPCERRRAGKDKGSSDQKAHRDWLFSKVHPTISRSRLLAEADDTQRVIHFRLGKPRPVRTVRLGKDLLLDVDPESLRIAGLWMLNVPPSPTPLSP